MKKLLMILTGLFCLISNDVWSALMAPRTVIIKTETATDIIDIKYPQGFADKQIDAAVSELISQAQKSFEKPDPDLADLPADIPGKNGLNIAYQLMFQNKRALSLLFNLSAYARGAAHPANSVQTLNFIDGKPVSLADLFKKDTGYLAKIAEFSLKVLQKKNISDAEWLNKGTSATAINYKNWYFNQKGIAIVFDTYQVAAYVYGPQTVTIPRSVIQDFIRPDIAKTLWGN